MSHKMRKILVSSVKWTLTTTHSVTMKIERLQIC